MFLYPSPTSLIFGLVAICAVIACAHGDYLIGVGSYDMTGPAAGVNMMGYGNLEQVTAGLHFRLRARAFVVAEGPQGSTKLINHQFIWKISC